MGKNKLHRTLTPLDTGVHGSATKEQGSAVVELRDMGDHIDKLKQVSLMNQTLANLLADQLQGLSGTIPVLRGFEIMKELRGHSKECRDGLQDALEPLRTLIERKKTLFYTNNAEAIEKIIRERVHQGIKRKLPIVLKERLRRYEEYLKTNSILTDKIEQTMEISSARDANSLLRANRPDEEVSLIPPHPDWSGLTLGGLKNISGTAVAKLASDQGLSSTEDSPDSEPARIRNLNMVLRHLGIHYQAIPSWNGILFTSVMRETGH